VLCQKVKSKLDYYPCLMDGVYLCRVIIRVGGFWYFGSVVDTILNSHCVLLEYQAGCRRNHDFQLCRWAFRLDQA